MNPAEILMSDFRPPELWTVLLLCFKPPGLWSFVWAALGNSPLVVLDTLARGLYMNRWTQRASGLKES